MSAELPIFPLNTVLFPGGALPLRIFEQRYMTMASVCLRQGNPFGVCLIEKGAEVGAPAQPHAVGSSARIVQWDMPQLGILQVTVHGGQRFRIAQAQADRHGLLRARVEWLDPEPSRPVPDTLAELLPLLRSVVEDLGEERVPTPHAFDDATWVGYRYAEILPIPLIARQKLLELDQPVSRLEIISRFLHGRGVLT